MEPPEPEAVGSLPRRADSRPATQRGIRPEKPVLISNSHSSAPTRTSGNNIAISVLHRRRQQKCLPPFCCFFFPSSVNLTRVLFLIPQKHQAFCTHLLWVCCDFLKQKNAKQLSVTLVLVCPKLQDFPPLPPSLLLLPPLSLLLCLLLNDHHMKEDDVRTLN